MPGQLKKSRARSEWQGEQWGLLGRDDRGDNNSIGLTVEIIPLLSRSYMIPNKHLIFAQLLICAPLFIFFIYLSSSPGLPAALEIILFPWPVDLTCWSSCFTLVYFVPSQDSIKETLSVPCPTSHCFQCICSLIAAVKPEQFCAVFHRLSPS